MFNTCLLTTIGYEWIGWKRPSSSPSTSSAPVNLVFAFDTVRSFSRVDIHVDNHFTKDVQVFKEAKVRKRYIYPVEGVINYFWPFQIYFSNEEDKFGDDRRVDFTYMPDLAIERARNVSIRLKGQHGKYVMMQLYFEAKWMLVSEVTFVSGTYVKYSLIKQLHSRAMETSPFRALRGKALSHFSCDSSHSLQPSAASLLSRPASASSRRGRRQRSPLTDLTARFGPQSALSLAHAPANHHYQARGRKQQWRCRCRHRDPAHGHPGASVRHPVRCGKREEE